MTDAVKGHPEPRPGRACTRAILRMAGLRPTRQRLILCSLLFTGRDFHVTAEELHNRVQEAGGGLSLATVYNTLNQFCEHGLLRAVMVDATATYFDTDTSDHHHFYFEDERRIEDVSNSAITIDGLPKPPPGTRIKHVDVVIRVHRT